MKEFRNMIIRVLERSDNSKQGIFTQVIDKYGMIPDLALISYKWGTYMPEVALDLKEVRFDFEGFTFYRDHNSNPADMLGFQDWLGFPFIGCYAGGDWEFPVYFIIYHDGSDFRAFIPEEGNLYNTQTKQAFGNDEEDDEENIRLRDLEYDDSEDLVQDAEIDWKGLREVLRKKFKEGCYV